MIIQVFNIFQQVIVNSGWWYIVLGYKMYVPRVCLRKGTLRPHYHYYYYVWRHSGDFTFKYPRWVPAQMQGSCKVPFSENPGQPMVL